MEIVELIAEGDRREPLCCVAERMCVESPFPQRVQRPSSRSPWLAGAFLGLGTVEVEVSGKERPTSPLPIGILQLEQPRPKRLSRNPIS